jgi:hypothetical protein
VSRQARLLKLHLPRERLEEVARCETSGTVGENFPALKTPEDHLAIRQSAKSQCFQPDVSHPATFFARLRR